MLQAMGVAKIVTVTLLLAATDVSDSAPKKHEAIG
jgi:hypothetical protein